MPKMSINQDDAYGSAKQVAQLRNRHYTFYVVTGFTLSCVQAYCGCNTSNQGPAGAA